MVVFIFCTGWLIKEIFLPLGVAGVYNRDFMRLTVACDSAMEASWYQKKEDPSAQKADLIHLLDCHEYDQTRKILLSSGLPETYLSWLGLKALEIHQRPASEFVEAHRFRER